VNQKSVIQIDTHLVIEKECDKQTKNRSQNGLPAKIKKVLSGNPTNEIELLAKWVFNQK
jgi:hypothetical protein